VPSSVESNVSLNNNPDDDNYDNNNNMNTNTNILNDMLLPSSESKKAAGLLSDSIIIP
jgi:hypothetical protein